MLQQKNLTGPMQLSEKAYQTHTSSHQILPDSIQNSSTKFAKGLLNLETGESVTQTGLWGRLSSSNMYN